MKSWKQQIVARFYKPSHDFLGREACFWEDQIVTRFPKSWGDFEKDLQHELGFKANRGTILSIVARFWLQKIFPIYTEVGFKSKGYNFGERKCDFNTRKTAEGAISSSLIQFMYVLILSLIMLFVTAIMSS